MGVCGLCSFTGFQKRDLAPKANRTDRHSGARGAGAWSWRGRGIVPMLVLARRDNKCEKELLQVEANCDLPTLRQVNPRAPQV